MSSNASSDPCAEGTTKVFSAYEERKWNRISSVMSQFHDMFKMEFNTVYELADGSFSKRRMSLSRYLDEARQLVTHLNMHHSIEEKHIFPKLAQRMPAFDKKGKEGHVNSHRMIHKGLDDLSALVSKYKADSTTYSPDEMRACLDSFRDVLFRHLDEEVADLSGENMKKYWKLEEMDGFGI